MSLITSESEASLQNRKRELELDQREFDIVKRETLFDLRQREVDLEYRQRDADLKEREREFERKKRDFQQEQRDVLFQQQQHTFQQTQRESRIEDQLTSLELEKKSLAVQQRDLDVQRRVFELDKREHEHGHHTMMMLGSENELWSRQNDNNNDDGGDDDLVPSWSLFTPSGETLQLAQQPSTLTSTTPMGKTTQKNGKQKKSGIQPPSIVSLFPSTSAQSEVYIAKAVEKQLELKWVQTKNAKRQLKQLSKAVVAASDNLRSERSTFDKFRTSEVARLDSDRAAFNEECTEHTKLITKIRTESETKVQVARAETEACEKKFAIIQERKLIGDTAQSLWNIPSHQFSSIFETIDACNRNSKHYGASAKTQVRIEFQCEQLSKQTHLNATHYLDLLRFIFDTGDRKHINPHDPKVIASANTILSYYWKSDSGSGRAPKLTPDLKVFFSSPNISNGDWIQFHGPGTILYKLDSGFKLTLGSLCNPEGKDSFKSIDHTDPEVDPDGKYNGKTATSHYQIKFKWE